MADSRGRHPDVLTVTEAATLLGISRNTLYDAIGRGEVPHQRIGKLIRLSRARLLGWLSCNKHITEMDREER